MTTHSELIERLEDGSTPLSYKKYAEAAQALRELEAENERLTAKLTQDPKDARGQLFKQTQEYQADAERYNKMKVENERLREWLVELNGFRSAAASCIKSGESWSGCMQAAFDRSEKPKALAEAEKGDGKTT